MNTSAKEIFYGLLGDVFGSSKARPELVEFPYDYKEVNLNEPPEGYEYVTFYLSYIPGAEEIDEEREATLASMFNRLVFIRMQKDNILNENRTEIGEDNEEKDV